MYVDLCAEPVSPKPLHPFDPYDKVPREIRRMLRSHARSIYRKKRRILDLVSAISSEHASGAFCDLQKFIMMPDLDGGLNAARVVRGACGALASAPRPAPPGAPLQVPVDQVARPGHPGLRPGSGPDQSCPALFHHCAVNT